MKAHTNVEQKTYKSGVVHITRVIVCDPLAVHAGVRLLFEVAFSSIRNVLLVNMNVRITVWPGLLVVEAHGVADLVGDGAELRKESQHGVPRIRVSFYYRNSSENPTLNSDS